METPASFHDQPAAQAFWASQPDGSAAYTRLRRALFREKQTWHQALGLLAPGATRAFGERFQWTTARLVTETRAPDGSLKALWEAPDGGRYESVLIRRPGRSTLCVSSQVGCAMGCSFCSTARLGLVRDLSAAEILEQATWAVDRSESSGERLRNVVFMGMGEPLLAPETVGAALEGLMDQRRFELAPRYLCVSTCGVTGAIEAFWRRFPRVKLAVSLHAPRQDLRDRLMPGCRRWPLSELMSALDGYSRATGHRLFLEYIMIRGINDGDREREELAALLEGRDAHVNLIPYNPGAGSGWEPSPQAVIERFRDELRLTGTAATVRRSAGDTIAAACGQLAGKVPSGNS